MFDFLFCDCEYVSDGDRETQTQCSRDHDWDPWCVWWRRWAKVHNQITAMVCVKTRCFSGKTRKTPLSVIVCHIQAKNVVFIWAKMINVVWQKWIVCLIVLKVEDEPLSEMSVALEGTGKCLLWQLAVSGFVKMSEKRFVRTCSHAWNLSLQTCFIWKCLVVQFIDRFKPLTPYIYEVPVQTQWEGCWWLVTTNCMRTFQGHFRPFEGRFCGKRAFIAPT